MSSLEVLGVSVLIAGQRILDEVDLQAGPGELIGVIGPNGSGKSTLLRTCFRALVPAGGQIRVDGTCLAGLSARRIAQQVAVVLQERPSEFEFTVADVVMMGRAPHQRAIDRESGHDRQVVAEALAQVGVAGLAGRLFSTLSGGEKQRVLIARALAQQARVLLLDEPTNHLDIRFQLEVMELVAGLGLTTVAAIHDLNLAASYCDRIYVLADGRVRAVGVPAQVLAPPLIREVFGVGALVDHNKVTGKVQLSFYPSSAEQPTQVPTAQPG
ncbi:MAG: ABC transporter ATP-binding protein [Pseudonocardiales bacterium]